ncbi:hypothetical protein AQPE_5065 [Aquipluma nitroreducens]|uniref:Curlin associated repeat-containing protein n=1 Tax=Aquipluma nitroreducens TaxID=2010828 RepID=A0A5K7SGX0_9BACT|nr:hypothetical protein [Aquipluma nitroreducens]BBE20870.1 hypothetical protein AQPE_5065 [Aquipluma nitroreducens]
MKKVSLFLGFAFMACMVFAQNNATVNQFGSNIGSVNQDGSGNNATIQQGSSGAAVTNNHAPAYVGDWIQGSYIHQIGQTNTAEATVRQSGNGTDINQVGDVNTAKQDVGSYYEETTSYTKMGLDIDQIGGNNWATQKTIKTYGNFGVQGMTVYQGGNYNIADQVSIGGMGQVQSIKQVGDNNNNPIKSGNTFDLSSTTINNPLAVLQNPLTLAFTFGAGAQTVSLPLTQYSKQELGKATIDVLGSDNNTYQFQETPTWGGGKNQATIDLIGNKNDVAQGQLGALNNSDFDLTGDENVVSNSQLGNSNIADVNILGSYNVVGIEQTGDLNNATVNQTGNSNLARIIQQP